MQGASNRQGHEGQIVFTSHGQRETYEQEQKQKQESRYGQERESRERSRHESGRIR
jgi:hypothetical protein